MLSGVASCTSEMRITMLTVSAAPRTASARIESQSWREMANTTVARPKTITAWNMRMPARRLMAWRARAPVMSKAPTAGTAQHAQSPRPGVQDVARIDRQQRRRPAQQHGKQIERDRAQDRRVTAHETDAGK